MPTKNPLTGRWAIGVALALAIWLGLQVAVVMADGPETYAMPQVDAQTVLTPTPFRFLTPTPFVARPATSTSAPNGGGFPIELALPVLAGGLTAIGGGSFLLRRKTPR